MKPLASARFGLAQGRTYLRWVGGKMRWASRLIRFVPRLNGAATYFEPFLGGASMFLAIRPKKAVLSDKNPDLIHSYRFVRDSPRLIARYLREHARRHCRDYYYQVRTSFNRRMGVSAAQAARFIYLNRTCFNGIYRVNRIGEFNVPCGKPVDAIFPTPEHLRCVSTLLWGNELRVASFREAVASAGRGDFVYLDPPYPPLNGTAFFRHYTADRFEEEDHEAVREVVDDLVGRGCHVMVTNADTDFIRSLYSRYVISRLEITRFVGGSCTKQSVGELVITNYAIKTRK